MSAEKLFGLVRKNGRISVSTRKLLNLCDYRQKVESVRVPKNLFGLVEKNSRISVSARKLLNPSDYPQKVESVRVLKNCPDQYAKMVESV